jgi:hypothetical protein
MISATCPYVYDANGRRIFGVIASNPTTGEVIRYQIFHGFLWELVHQISSISYHICYACGVRDFGGEILTAHGFHPAPLRIVPRTL